MSYIAEKMFPKTSAETPMIHDDTKGTLPAGRIAVNGEHGDPAVDPTLMSILAYDPLTDDAGQWHPITTGWHGMFQDSTIQTIASPDVAYPITYNTTDISSGITLGTPASRVVFAYDGIYDLEFSAQLQNTSTTEHDVAIWLRKNGVDIPASTGHITVPGRHGSIDGRTIGGWTHVLELSTNDYVELYWSSTSTAVSLHTVPAGTLPVYPTAASVFFSAVEVAPVIGGTGVGGGGGGDPTLGGDLSGLASDATVVGIHGQPVSATAPTSSQVLMFDGTQWEPATVPGLDPGTIRASDLATVLTPIFDEDGKIVYDATFGVLYTEIELEGV